MVLGGFRSFHVLVTTPGIIIRPQPLFTAPCQYMYMQLQKYGICEGPAVNHLVSEVDLLNKD